MVRLIIEAILLQYLKKRRVSFTRIRPRTNGVGREGPEASQAWLSRASNAQR